MKFSIAAVLLATPAQAGILDMFRGKRRLLAKEAGHVSLPQTLCTWKRFPHTSEFRKMLLVDVVV